MGNVLKRYSGTNWEAVGGTITGDTLPIGSEVDYTGTNIPAGWEEINDVLWTNSSPSSPFASQTINIDLSSCNTLLIKFYRNYNAPSEQVINTLVNVGDISAVNYTDYSNGTRSWNREITSVSNTGITFGSATLNGNTNNSYLVPYKIIKIN